MRSYQHHIGDFNNATRHLNRLERSLYRDLIELYYDTEQQLPDDLQWICRRIVANECSTDVEQLLNEFFTKTPKGWYHDRCEHEIEKYHSLTSQKAIAGKASAAKREEKRQQALNGCSTTVTNQEPRTKNQEPINNNTSAREAFVMSLDWMPNISNHDLESLCQLRGITAVDPLDPALLDEFRRYWAARGDPKTDAQWLNQWIKNLSRQQQFLAMDGAKLKIAIEKQGARNASRIDPCQQAATEYLRSQGFGREDFFETNGSDGAQVYEQLGNA